MADKGYAITANASRELARVIRDSRQRLPDAGRRTRRVWPDADDQLQLLQYTSTDALLGYVEGDGIEANGDCELVSDSGTTRECTSGTHFSGLLIPGMQFWGVKRSDGKYHVVYGGVHMLTGPCTGDGDTTITVTGGDIQEGGIDVQFFNACEDYAEGQVLTLGVSFGLSTDTKIGLKVLDACCPPDPA